MTFVSVLILVCLSTLAVLPAAVGWDANWESLDSRPLPSWYDKAKFGVFIHWGVFSVAGYDHTPWFWYWWLAGKVPSYQQYINDTEASARFAYQEYAERFDAALYDPEYWADVFAGSGAQYVVLTSKHHEGFCNWDSRDVPATANWNAMDIGPRRDLVGDLAAAIKNTTSPLTDRALRFGLYHSMLEFFNPAYLRDGANNWTTQEYVDLKALPELYDLVNKYEPDLLWGDGTWSEPSAYWKSVEFLAWYSTNSTVADEAVWNDRWGADCLSTHGGFYTPADRYDPGRLLENKWEDALTINTNSWGYQKDTTIGDFMTTKKLIHTLIETVAFGGNLLVNVGPGPDGTLDPILVDRLDGMGDWLAVNGEAIYDSQPWKHAQSETDVSTFYTRKGRMLYAIFTEWPAGNVLNLRAPTTVRKVFMLGLDGTLDWMMNDDGVHISIPPLTPDQVPCQHAWVLKIKHL